MAVKVEVERAACAGREEGRTFGTGNGPRLAKGHHELRDAGADQNRCTGPSAMNEIQLSQSATQAAN
eukprot:scaffold6725_cov77-Phaeocystis_antarctica.AAC.1